MSRTAVNLDCLKSTVACNVELTIYLRQMHIQPCETPWTRVEECPRAFPRPSGMQVGPNIPRSRASLAQQGMGAGAHRDHMHRVAGAALSERRTPWAIYHRLHRIDRSLACHAVVESSE